MTEAKRDRSEYYRKNRDKIRAQQKELRDANPGLSAEYQRRWREKNREAAVRAARIADQTRRARKAAAFVEYVDPDVVWERDGGICHICNTQADAADWHLDHVVPLARGGEHSYANCKVSHPGCNMSKGAKVAPCKTG